jgi:hypothetical protein
MSKFKLTKKNNTNDAAIVSDGAIIKAVVCGEKADLKFLAKAFRANPELLNIKIPNIILKRGMPNDMRDDIEESNGTVSLIHIAACCRKLDVLALLITAGANPNEPGSPLTINGAMLLPAHSHKMTPVDLLIEMAYSDTAHHEYKAIMDSHIRVVGEAYKLLKLSGGKTSYYAGHEYETDFENTLKRDGDGTISFCKTNNNDTAIKANGKKDFYTFTGKKTTVLVKDVNEHIKINTNKPMVHQIFALKNIPLPADSTTTIFPMDIIRQIIGYGVLVADPHRDKSFASNRLIDRFNLESKETEKHFKETKEKGIKSKNIICFVKEHDKPTYDSYEAQLKAEKEANKKEKKEHKK